LNVPCMELYGTVWCVDDPVNGLGEM
jgi:hypothetical protein